MKDIELGSVCRLTGEKTKHISERYGYSVTGFVLTNDKQKCIVDHSAVRWMSSDEFFNMIHKSDFIKKETIEDSVRCLSKWLNEEIESPIDKVSLATVLAYMRNNGF